MHHELQEYVYKQDVSVGLHALTANRCQENAIQEIVHISHCTNNAQSKEKLEGLLRKLYLLMRHGLEACGVCSLWTSVVRYVRLCAATSSCQH